MPVEMQRLPRVQMRVVCSERRVPFVGVFRISHHLPIWGEKLYRCDESCDDTSWMDMSLIMRGDPTRYDDDDDERKKWCDARCSLVTWGLEAFR